MINLIYFGIIILLAASFLSLVYLSYRQQEMRLTSKQMKDLSETYERHSRYS